MSKFQHFPNCPERYRLKAEIEPASGNENKRQPKRTRRSCSEMTHNEQPHDFNIAVRVADNILTRKPSKRQSTLNRKPPHRNDTTDKDKSLPASEMAGTVSCEGQRLLRDNRQESEKERCECADPFFSTIAKR